MTAKKQNPQKRGPKAGYDPSRIPAIARSLAESGKIEAEIALLLNVNPSTFTRWKEKYPELCTALNGGRDPVDDGVEKSLLQRAMGYEYDETKMVYDATDPREGSKPVKVERTKKRMAPDVTACIFWLKNRRPAQWRDKQQIEHSGQVATGEPTIDVSKLTPEEKREMLRLAEKAILDERA